MLIVFVLFVLTFLTKIRRGNHATSVQDKDSVLKKFKYDHFLNYFFAFGGSESKLVDVTVQ